MLVKSMTELGKLLTAVTLISAFPAQAQSWRQTTYESELHPNSSLIILYNHVKSMFGRLNEEDSRMHKQAVYHALNNLDNGEVVTWFNDDRSNFGRVEVVSTVDKNGDMCRRIYSFINVGSNQRSFEEWACYRSDSGVWKFSDK